MEMVVSKNRKFMQVFSETIYGELELIAKQKGVSIQELLRAVVVPDWLVKYRNVAGPIIARREQQPAEPKKDSWPYVAAMPRTR